MRIHVLIHSKPDILDVQGQAIQQAIHAAGFVEVLSVRTGKSIYLEMKDSTSRSLKPQIERICRETLSNPLIEDYRWEIVKT